MIEFKLAHLSNYLNDEDSFDNEGHGSVWKKYMDTIVDMFLNGI